MPYFFSVILYAIFASYFAGVMVRLMLTLTPIVCVLAAIAFSKTFEIYLKDDTPKSNSKEEEEDKKQDNKNDRLYDKPQVLFLDYLTRKVMWGIGVLHQDINFYICIFSSKTSKWSLFKQRIIIILLRKSLKPLHQIKLYLAGVVLRHSPFKIISDRHLRWPQILKIEISSYEQNMLHFKLKWAQI